MKDQYDCYIENELYEGKIKVKRIIKRLLSSPSQGTMVTRNGVSAMVRVTVIEFWLYFNHFLEMYTLLYLFIFGCAWVFVATYELFRVEDSRTTLWLQCVSFLLQWLLSLWSKLSRHMGFSSCDLLALEHSGFSSCDTQAQ